MKTLYNELKKNYDSKPIIVIYEKDQFEDIENIIKVLKFTHFNGVDPQTLYQIKDLSNGILTMDKDECRGIDARF